MSMFFLFVLAPLFLLLVVILIGNCESSPHFKDLYLNMDSKNNSNSFDLFSQNLELDSQKLQSFSVCAAQFIGRENECVENITHFEYRPFISIQEKKYKIYLPEIIYDDVMNPQERHFSVRVPSLFTTRVPFTQIKEVIETKTLVKIKLVDEKVAVVSKKVFKIPRKIPNPRVVQEIVKVPQIQVQTKKLRVKNLQSKQKKMVIDVFEEKPKIVKIRRPIVEKRIVRVNRTTVKRIPKIVEVPQVRIYSLLVTFQKVQKIILKTIRIPRPKIIEGPRVVIETSELDTKTREYEEEVPEYYDEIVEVDQIKREQKTVRIPYPEKTRIVRPIPVESLIFIPEKQIVKIAKHYKVDGPKIPVPCGIQAKGDLTSFISSPCPPCPPNHHHEQERGRRNSCPVCQKCDLF